MMKFIYLQLITILFAISGHCQNISSKELVKILSYGVGNQTSSLEMSLAEAKARNTQCYPNFFTQANLILSNGSSIEDLNVKYDFGEKILLIREENKVLIGAPNMIRNIDFNSSELTDLIHVGQMGRTYGKQGFYSILLKSGENYLLKYQDLTTIKKASEASINANDVYTRIEEPPVILVSEEVLLFKNNELYILPNFKTKTLEDLDVPLKQLKSFIKNEKLKYKNEDDLLRFADYFLTL